jgi:hypothetical protein
MEQVTAIVWRKGTIVARSDVPNDSFFPARQAFHAQQFRASLSFQHSPSSAVLTCTVSTTMTPTFDAIQFA